MDGLNASPRPPRPDRLLAWMGGLADATRIRILHLTERQELGVAELCAALRLPQSTVSRHLKVLSDDGWLEARTRATSRLYRMAEGVDAAARKFWRLAREQSAAWPALAQDRMRLARILEDRRGAADRFFAGAAADWDRLRTELYGSAWVAEAVLSLLPAGWTVADLGCGTGDFAARLARHVAHVHAVDRSTAMLKTAERRHGQRRNLTFWPSELTDLVLPDESCDAAFLTLVLTYQADAGPVLREAARVLRPGGLLVVVDLAPHGDEAFRRRLEQARDGFAPAEIAALCRDAGLAATTHPLSVEAGQKGPGLFLCRAQKPAA
jgi:ArsR family transcriptional regulator